MLLPKSGLPLKSIWISLRNDEVDDVGLRKIKRWMLVIPPKESSKKYKVNIASGIDEVKKVLLPPR